MTDGRRRLVVLAGFLISAAALYLVLRTLDLGQAVDVVTSADPLPLVAIVVVLTTIGVMPLVRLADRLGLSKRPRIRELIARFAESLGGPSRRPVIMAAVGLSGIAWLLDATSFWLAATSVDSGLDYPAAMLVDGVTVLGTAVPSAPGYVGTFEFAGAGMAGALGGRPAPAFALALLAHVMTLVPLAIGGSISLIAMGARLGDVASAAAATG